MPALAQAPAIAGDWLGTLDAGPKKLRLALHLKAAGSTFESIDQGASVPLKSYTLTGQAVAVDAGFASFDGVLDASGGRMAGTFHQGPVNLPLAFHRANSLELSKIEKPHRPQEPARPLPYREEEVGYAGGSGVHLAGTLTYPKSGGPFVTALLITGSGAQDRDEALMGHKPFLILSDYLTRAGFAVLRVDDRGMGSSGGVFEKTTYADKTADVLAGVAFLKTRKQVDASRIGLIGHSEGGIVGPLAAVQSKDVAFVVMLAGAGVPGADILKQQGIDLIRAASGDDAAIVRQVDMQAKLFEIMRTAQDEASARKALEAWLGPGPAAEMQLKTVLSPTFRDLASFDPGPVLRRISCPVLALNGAKDLQVSAKQNLPAIAAALAASSSPSWAAVQLPGLNHLFQTAKTGAVEEYSSIEETIAPAALQSIADWLVRNFR